MKASNSLYSTYPLSYNKNKGGGVFMAHKFFIKRFKHFSGIMLIPTILIFSLFFSFYFI